MLQGKLYSLKTRDPNRPIEYKYAVDLDGNRTFYEEKEHALLFLFDHQVTTYQHFSKEEAKYNDTTKLPTYELWHIENRLGYVLYDFEPFVDENGLVQKRRAYVWRFVGFGRSCFAPTKEELIEKVTSLVLHYQEDPDGRGYNSYPYYTKHYQMKGGNE